MRYATFLLDPVEGGVHPIETALTRSSSVTRGVIREVNLLNDGTAVVLYTLTGDLERARELLAALDSVHTVHVGGDQEGMAFVHFEPNATVRTLLDIVDDNEFALDRPIECNRAGGLRVTLIGEQQAISRATDLVPAEVGLQLEGTGEYDPRSDELATLLTDRQREVLAVAVDEGYYEEPRQTTHEEIARTVGLTAGTVGEHLRKAEERILAGVVGR